VEGARRVTTGFSGIQFVPASAVVALGLLPWAPGAAAAQAMVSRELLPDTTAAPSVHASTIVESGGRLMAAWFGGSREGAADVGVWVARRVDGEWTRPVEAADGAQAGGARYPCWNPVLFEIAPGAVALFYKVGPSPQRWWGMVRTSRDGGRTWSAAERLPGGILGPIKDKPLRLADGSILSPGSTESTDDPSRWRVHFERSVDGGRSWTVSTPPSPPAGREVDAIQPSLLVHGDGRLQALVRTRSGWIFDTWSADDGLSWSPLSATTLPNPNSGLDGTTLRDGRQLVVYNHTQHGRTPLNVAVSVDGVRWDPALVLEDEEGEFSYPAVIQTADGLVHITYTWKRRRIAHVVLDPTLLR
jgi:predicted neuraminidase